MADTPTAVHKENLEVVRIIDAPLELVWQAWTEPEHVRRWWGPKYYTSPVCKVDFREGGSYLFCMRAPAEQGGQDAYTSGVFEKIVPLERLEFTQGLSDAEGNRLDPAELGMPPDFPKRTRTIVTFRARGDMTEVTIKEYDWTPGTMFVYALAGWQQSMDKLAASVNRKR